ncbi:MAG: hypothetical protein E6K16_08090 [Methanobacteriota archaeon]|nr:MAG: hypothetical protein E6K16_08090 [Euryarchaeota archaeon]
MPKLASNLVRSCLRIRPDDNVTIFFYPHTTELAEDIAEECFRIGADVNLSAYTDRFYESYMKLLPEESLRKPSVFCRALTEVSTAEFWLGGLYDPAVFRRIPPEKQAAADEGEYSAHFPLARDRKVRSLFVALSQITRPRAKAYGYSFPRWQKMMNAASAVPASKLQADGRRLAALLATSDHVHVKDDGGTDLEFSMRGRRPQINDGVVDEDDIAAGALEAAIPAGSVAIAPLEDSANGTIEFNVPQAWAGRSIRKLGWEFSGGRIVSWSGDKNADLLHRAWAKGAGSEKDRIGGLTVGLNPRAELGFLQNPIVRGAVSISIGGNEELGGANTNSFPHQQTLAGANLTLDGKPIVKAGKLLLP